jgi:hypothetical protein
MRARIDKSERMLKEISLEECRVLAKTLGLQLSDEELQPLLAGINRAKKQAAELREIIDATAEPSAAFAAAMPKRK